MSRIVATYTEDADGTGSFDNGVAFCAKVPAVIYQARLSGAVTRVERDGKGDHLSLVRSGRAELIVCSSGGPVGILGYSHQCDAWVVEAYGRTDFARPGSRERGWHTEHASREDAIGEAALAFIA